MIPPNLGCTLLLPHFSELLRKMENCAPPVICSEVLKYKVHCRPYPLDPLAVLIKDVRVDQWHTRLGDT